MSNQIIPADIQENDDQVFVPASVLLPPNQILTKAYAPDFKPGFKLIISDKQQQPKTKIINDVKSQYGDIFRQCDTLGYEYCVMMRKELVYLKLNNADYMKLTLKGKTLKYLGGFFIPLEKLLCENVKIHKNVYKVLPRVNYIDNKHPVDNSLSSNCFSQSPALKFSSNYQSANLFAAVRTSQTQYDLILQNDINSKGNTQWFNFTVFIAEERNYKFNIVNLTKSSSLYQKGMTVVMHSQASKLISRTGWTRGCHNIAYSRTNINREDNQNSYYYKLHFQYKSLYKTDVVTFSYCFPYTSLDLQKFFNKIQFKRMVNSLKIQKIKINETLSGFPLYVYSITYRRHLGVKKSLNSYRTIADMTSSSIVQIPSLVFMARQHPGESQGSYVLEGVVEWLMENDYDGWKKTFNFYIVPMINIDGVYYGNYRTNLSGNDLNRVWRQPRKDYHCQVYSLKKYLHELNKFSPIALIIDIHGHSNSLNSFFYGNPVHKDSENPRLFPYYCSRKVRQISFHQSTFSVSEDKKSCARVVLGQMFPKALVYTFQNSFCGWRRGKHLIQHTIESYRKLGRQLVQCYVQYSRLCEKNPVIKQRWIKEIQQINKEPKVDEEEVLNESDDEIDGELVDFMEKLEEQLDTSLNKELNGKVNDRKKENQSVGKTKFVKYMHRPSPMKIKNYSSSNQAYAPDKLGEMTESMGFLSIVKINTRSNIDSFNHSEHAKLIQIRNAIRRYEQKKQEKDQIIEDDPDNTKQNTSQKYIKVGKLIGDKEMASQKIRMRRFKMQQGLMHNKTFNGFFKYNIGQK